MSICIGPSPLKAAGQMKRRATYAPAAKAGPTQNRVKQEYAYQVITRQLGDRGRSVSRERLPSGEIEVTIAGYR